MIGKNGEEHLHGVTPSSSPTVSLSVSETDLVEGDEFTFNFAVDGDIPQGGLTVFVDGPPAALSEFDIFGDNGIDPDTDLVGLASFPELDDDASGFSVTIIEPAASITLSVLDDGPTESTEFITFELANGEQYEPDPDASTVDLTINDGGEDVEFDLKSGTVSVFFDLELLEAETGLTLVSIDSEGTPFSDAFQVGFPITEDTDFRFNPLRAPSGGTIELAGALTFALGDTQVTLGEFSIGFDPARFSDIASGIFVADTLDDELGLDILFDIGSQESNVSNDEFDLSGANVLLAPELVNALGLADIAGTDVGNARIDGTVQLVTEPPDDMPPLVSGEPATISVSDTGSVVGNVFQAGGLYDGELFSNTDAEFGGSESPDDVILGTDGDDNIWGGTEGSDLMSALEGNDTVGFSDGDARVDAGPGDDFVYAAGSGAGTNQIELGSGNDKFWAPAGNNTVTGSDNNEIGIGTGDDTVMTQDGDDFVYTVNDGGGSNTLNLGEGLNRVYLENGDYEIATGSGDDEFGLGTGTDTIDAGDGENFFYLLDPSGATTGDKDILTGAGDDFVRTGAGSDQIDAGAGRNTLFGGAGMDEFVLRSGAFNFIGDFEPGVDEIRLDGLTFGDLSFSQGSGDAGVFVFVTPLPGSFTAQVAIAQLANLTVAELDDQANFPPV